MAHSKILDRIRKITMLQSKMDDEATKLTLELVRWNDENEISEKLNESVLALAAEIEGLADTIDTVEAYIKEIDNVQR